MSEPQQDAPWPPYRVLARNISRDAGPSVHSDEVARSLGFSGALVAGRAIYSHLLHPLVERFGEAFLARGRAEVTFIKPAYEGDALTVITEPAPQSEGGRAFVARARKGEDTNEENIEVARLETSLPEPFPEPNPLANPEPPPFSGHKQEGSWELLEPGKPLGAFPWHPRRDDNLRFCEDVGEALPVFHTGEAPPLHPGLLPTATTELLHQQLIIRGWVHVSSIFLTHHLLRAGQAYELRATPTEKWERNGKHFVKLYVAVIESADRAARIPGGRVLAEETRTALIKGE